MQAWAADRTRECRAEGLDLRYQHAMTMSCQSRRRISKRELATDGAPMHTDKRLRRQCGITVPIVAGGSLAGKDSITASSTGSAGSCAARDVSSFWYDGV